VRFAVPTFQLVAEMTTVFDFLTVVCFILMVIAFLLLTERHPRTLVHLLLSGIAFAIANQVGNAGSTLLGLMLVCAGVGYAVLVIQSKWDGRP
jgi:hypothetical protein